MSDWIPLIHPLELYAVLTISGVSLLYALAVHARLHSFVRDSRKRGAELERRVVTALEEAARLAMPAAAPAPSPGRSLHLNQRGQVLRMRNRGEKPETISAALGIPRNEVDLLFKVQQLAQEQVESRARG